MRPYGAPYFTGATLFWLEPQQKAILSRETTLFDDVLLEHGTVLVQAFGQDGGHTGRAVWVGEQPPRKGDDAHDGKVAISVARKLPHTSSDSSSRMRRTDNSPCLLTVDRYLTWT